MNEQANRICDNSIIKGQALSFYQILFNGEGNLFLLQIQTRMQIKDRWKEYLSAPISTDGVNAALVSIEDSRSPGSNRFSSKFYNLHWDFQQKDLVEVISENFVTKKLPKGLNHNFITLIPKNISPKHF